MVNIVPSKIHRFKIFCIWQWKRWKFKRFRKTFKWWRPKHRYVDYFPLWGVGIIRCSKNNIFITMLDAQGKVVKTLSTSARFKGKKRRTALAAKSIAVDAGFFMKTLGIKFLVVLLRSPIRDWRVRGAIAGFKRSSLIIGELVLFATRVHNGIRLKGVRRKKKKNKKKFFQGTRPRRYRYARIFKRRRRRYIGFKYGPWWLTIRKGQKSIRYKNKWRAKFFKKRKFKILDVSHSLNLRSKEAFTGVA